MTTLKKKIAVIGGGAAGIMCACHLDSRVYDVTIFEKTSRLGRKLLVAGEGGFNLTFEQPVNDMITKYHPPEFVKQSITNFDNKALRLYLKNIGIETFVGTSNRVFPRKGIKPYQVVEKIIGVLKDKNVTVEVNCPWQKWEVKDGRNIHTIGDKDYSNFDYVVFALGGGSWKKTGSDGKWSDEFKKRDIDICPFEASNCTWLIDWKKSFIETEEGMPLKNIVTKVNQHTVKGEILITKGGLEGGAIYAQSYNLRSALKKGSNAELLLDLKPNLSIEKIANILSNRKKSIKHTLTNVLKLNRTATKLLGSYVNKEDYVDHEKLSSIIKNFKLSVIGCGPLDQSISSVGGVLLHEVDSKFELKKYKDHYVIGEMLNWDAPTGGYLLQNCFSMGVRVSRHINQLFKE